MVVPTSRPRHFVTESDELERALDAAAKRWPGLSRPKLLVHLALVGAEAESSSAAAKGEARRAALKRHSGALSGVYPQGYLEALRAEWRE